jgi:WD40 repeat protein
MLTDAASGKHLSTMEVGQTVWTLAWSPDGRSLATNGNLTHREVLVWDVRTGKLRSRLSQSTRPGTRDLERLSLAWGPDGRTLATTFGGDRSVTLWNVDSARPDAVLAAPASINAVAWSTRGRGLAGGCQNNTVVLWDPVHRHSRGILRGHTGAVTALSWAPDGRTLASGSEDGTVRVWSPRTGRQLATFYLIDAGRDWVTATPEGHYEASPGAERFIHWRQGAKLWPVEKFRRRFERPDLVRKALAGQPVTGGRR